MIGRRHKRQLGELAGGEQLALDFGAPSGQGSSWQQVYADLTALAWALAVSERTLVCRAGRRAAWQTPAPPLSQVPSYEDPDVAAARTEFWTLTGRLYDLTAAPAGTLVADLLAAVGANKTWLARHGQALLEGASQ